jgi:NAD(P)-dependent dehydrogenase (short-subunit alcohol dehydrogenase family)
MQTLLDKVALVTGAGSGLGQAIAEGFAAARAFVYCTDCNAATVAATVTRIREAGGQAEAVTHDVRSEDDCARVAALVHQRHGHLDVLMNNAGVGHVGTMLTTTGADLDRVLAVNVRGVFNCTKVFLPRMVERGRGSIIHMASTTGISGVLDRLAYSVSKHAVVGLTKSMALDHAKTGVRVNCICPGRIETPFMLARIQEYPDPKAAYREMSDTQAIGRMGRPEEIAAVALFLASDASSFMTGSAVVADGGWTAGRS